MLLVVGLTRYHQPDSALNAGLHLIGNDDLALLIGVLFSFFTLGKLRGFTRDTILTFSNECLAPTATITLLVGAGGGFGRMLQDSGVSHCHHQYSLCRRHVPLLLLAWLLAALMRLATGSATVAMTTAAGIVARSPSTPLAFSLSFSRSLRGQGR